MGGKPPPAMSITNTNFGMPVRRRGRRLAAATPGAVADMSVACSAAPDMVTPTTHFERVSWVVLGIMFVIASVAASSRGFTEAGRKALAGFASLCILVLIVWLAIWAGTVKCRVCAQHQSS